jgi:hypothetical protein
LYRTCLVRLLMSDKRELPDVRLLDGDKVGVGVAGGVLLDMRRAMTAAAAATAATIKETTVSNRTRRCRRRFSPAAVSCALVLSSSRRPASACVTLLPWLIWPCRMVSASDARGVARLAKAEGRTSWKSRMSRRQDASFWA